MAHIKDRGKGVNPDNRWQARYVAPDGRERSSTFPRKLDAQRWLDEVTVDIVTGRYVAPDAGRITFKQYAETWRKAQVHRPSSAELVERHLRLHAYPTFGDQPLASILPSHVQGWVKGLTLTLAPSTVAVIHGLVAAVFKSAIRDRRLTSSPCEGSKLPEQTSEEVVVLELEMVLAIEAAMPARYRAAVPLAYSTGVRQGEAMGLTVDRSGLRPLSVKPLVRVDRQLVTIGGEAPYLGPPKRRASRRDIPLPRTGVEVLAAHLAAYPPTVQEIVCRDAGSKTWTETVELVFTTRDGRPVRRSKFAELFAAAVKTAGAPAGTTYHDLRHFYASLLIRHGESVKTVQKRLGHATATETLNTYTHLWPDSEDRTREAVDIALAAVTESSRNEDVAGS